MGLKILYNVFLNIGVIILAIGVFRAFGEGQYLFAFVALAAMAVLIWLKIRLMRAIRNTTKK